MNRAILIALALSGILVGCNASWAADKYEIEAAANDEVFIINGEKYEAQTYGLGWDEGDTVIFMDGSPLGVCVSATLYNLSRRDSCEVWCE
jgi:hypothetical protein